VTAAQRIAGRRRYRLQMIIDVDIGCSLGRESTLHIWNTHECNSRPVTFETSPVQLPSGQAPNRKMTFLMCMPAVVR
jgi:hypothetical protein